MDRRRLAFLGLALALAACGAPTPSDAPASGAPASPVASGSKAPGAGWRPGPVAPVALIEGATAVHDGRIWTAGGLTADGTATDAVLVLDPATSEFTDGPALPEPMHHAALVSDGTDLWLLGGYLGDTFEQTTDAVWRLPGGAVDAAWEPGPPLPERRAAGAAVWDGARIVYGGGVGNGILGDLVFVLGAEGSAPVARLTRAREHLAAATDGEGRTWFLGGRQGGLAGNVSRVDLVVGEEVTSLGELSLARGGIAAFHWPSLGACVSGGEAPSQAYQDVECVGADGTLTTLPPMAEARHGHGAVVVDGRAYQLFGGHVPALSVSATTEVLALP
jgi:hypothetical protein